MADQSKGTKRTTPGAVVFTVFVVLATLIPFVQSGEFTFELADRDQQCFHEEFKEKGKEVILEFQVSCNPLQLRNYLISCAEALAEFTLSSDIYAETRE